ncbi:TPM domain-containing protein [Candidatus Pacearchaeota archaeon]|nr:TPM domain-containing protein [Candidatus Pacearchaeota archaeon]
MMKKGANLFSITLVFTLFLVFSFSLVSAFEFPAPTNDYVNDYANIFSQEEKAMLSGLLEETRANTTAEFVIVTIDSCQGDYDGYAQGLATQWGIGKKDKNNGLLALYCKEEKRFVVKTGYGLEGILPDSKIGRYLDEFYVPSRDSGNVSRGIILFSIEMSKILIENSEEIKSGQAGKSNDSSFMLIILAVILILFIIFIIKMKKAQAKLLKNKKTPKELKDPKNKKYKYLVGFGNFGSIMLFIAYIITGLIAFFIGGIVLAIVLRFFIPKELRAASGFLFLPSHHSGSSFGSGFGGGFGGGSFGGGGASR